MPTRLNVRETLVRNRIEENDAWNSVTVPLTRNTDPRVVKARATRKDYITSLDPQLKQSFEDALKFLKEEHGYVYWGSSWSNCTDFDMILGRYHGVSEWSHRCNRDIDMSEEFAPVDISPRQILLDGFEWFQVKIDKMRDVNAAGGVDTAHIDDHEKRILSFLEDLKSRDEALSLA